MIHLKSGSLPLVNPDQSKIEAKLLEGRRTHYTLEILSNRDEHIVTIVAPEPGDWFAIAYRSWHDPNKNKIKQQGILIYFLILKLINILKNVYTSLKNSFVK